MSSEQDVAVHRSLDGRYHVVHEDHQTLDRKASFWLVLPAEQLGDHHVGGSRKRGFETGVDGQRLG